MVKTDKKLNEHVTDLRTNTSQGKEKSQNNPPKSFPLNLKIIILGIVLTFLVINGVFAYGIYGLGWNGKVTKLFVNVMPYPAALVGGNFVKVGDYFHNLDSYKNYYQVAQKTDFKTEEGQKIFKTLKDDILNQLIEEKIIKKEAAKMNIKVNKTEVDEEYKKLVDANGEDTLKNQIKNYYNWDVSEFKQKIASMLLRKKLEDKVKQDDNLNKDKKAKAEEILKRIKNGEDFATVAKESSEDPSGANGGSLGTISKGQLTPELDDKAFSLNPGETSDVIKTIYGYHIIKVTDKKDDEVSLSQILIKNINFDDWLKQKEAEYKVKKLLNLDKIKS